MNPLQPPRSPSMTPHMSPKSGTPETFSPLNPGTPLAASPKLGPVKPLAPLAPPSRRPSSTCGGDSLGLALGGLGLNQIHPTHPSTLAPRPSFSGTASPSHGPAPLMPPSRSPSPRPQYRHLSVSPSPVHHPKPLAPPMVEDGHWKEGDFEIISSDNVRFRIASFHLLSASTALRSAAEFADARHRRALHFTGDHEEIETALVIRSFLRVITTGQVATTPDGTGTPSVAALRRLILFVKKYECPVALQLVLFKIHDMLSQGISVPMYSFILGATADDIETCWLSLKYLQQTWNASQTPTPNGSTGGAATNGPEVDVRNEGTPGAPTIDPNNIPYTLWQWIPQDYMWALSRSWGMHVKDNRVRLPDEFRRVLNLIKASSLESEGRRRSVIFH